MITQNADDGEIVENKSFISVSESNNSIAVGGVLRNLRLAEADVQVEGFIVSSGMIGGIDGVDARTLLYLNFRTFCCVTKDIC